MKLSRTERWMLSNQFLILKALYPTEAEYYDKLRDVVESGYEGHYSWINQHIFEDTMSEAECKEVLNILALYRQLKSTYENLDDTTGIDEIWVEFRGFDGNNEINQTAYTRFLVDKENRYTELSRGDDFNSHSPVLGKYRKMLTEWKNSSDKYNLTQADLVRITNA